jgi:hypothetical protein
MYSECADLVILSSMMLCMQKWLKEARQKYCVPNVMGALLILLLLATAQAQFSTMNGEFLQN